jgi:hypothetical protein
MGALADVPGAEVLTLEKVPGAIVLPPRDAPAAKAATPKADTAGANHSALTAMMHGAGAAERGAGAVPGVAPDPTPAPSWMVAAAEAAANAPLIAAGGGGLGLMAAKLGAPAVVASKVAPAVGRVATVGGLAAAKEAGEGKDVLSLPVLLDIAVASLVEAGTAGVAGVGKKLAKPLTEARDAHGAQQRAFAHATAAPKEALDAIRARLGNVKSIVVPSLGPGKMSLDDAVKKLSTLERHDYEQARAEMVNVLNRLEKGLNPSQPAPRAGTVFKNRTADTRFAVAPFAADVSPLRYVAEKAMQTANRPMVRAGAESTLTEDIPGTSIPIGVGAAALPSAAWKSVLRRLTP